MKLSEAMRKGSELTQPISGVFLHEERKDGTITHACALGACYVGVEGVDGGFRQIADYLMDRWPELDSMSHPHEQSTMLRLGNIIMDLNDEKGKTREQIADWLEGLGY